MITEEWRPLAGYNGKYEVSSLGVVRSYYTNPCTKRTTLITLKPGANKSGHLFLYLGRGNKQYVHRLVLETFIGPCPPGLECLHADDVPSHNWKNNLSWGTRKENVAAMLKAHPNLRKRPRNKPSRKAA